MIYVSSSSVRSATIYEAVTKLYAAGFKNIELSSGTEYYEGIADDLERFKKEKGVNFILHNYFPPPREHFVINLASLNDDIYKRTVSSLRESLALSVRLGITKYGFHAGFYIDILLDEVGRDVGKRELYDVGIADEVFCSRFNELKKVSRGVKLYLENNVLSDPARRHYPDKKPFMLLDSQDHEKLSKKIDFDLLLDVAHLKVTCETLGLDYEKELKNMIPKTDHIHLSGVDCKGNQHLPLDKDEFVLGSLSDLDISNKDITLEINGSIEEIRRSYDMVEDMI